MPRLTHRLRRHNSVQSPVRADIHYQVAWRESLANERQLGRLELSREEPSADPCERICEPHPAREKRLVGRARPEEALHGPQDAIEDGPQPYATSRGLTTMTGMHDGRESLDPKRPAPLALRGQDLPRWQP